MPSFSLNKDWSAPITVQAGDYLQNKGGGEIEVCAIEPASSSDSLLIPIREAVEIKAATTIRARAAELDAGVLTVARGF